MTPSVLPSGEDDWTGTEVQGLSGARYRFEHVLGAGSQAVAWRATRAGEHGSWPVVVKVWSTPFVRAHPELSRLVLRKESVALARFADIVPPEPFVLRLLDAGEVGSTPWIALERVPSGPQGANLRQRVERVVATTGKALGPRAAARVLTGLLDGTAALHQEGVIHRDLKPTNVLVRGESWALVPKIADLGVARAMGMQTTFGARMSVGSLGFAAPEQARDERVGTWSDVFSLGALLSFVLTGEAPVAGNEMTALAALHRGELRPLGGPRLHPAWGASGVLAALAEVRQRAMRARTRERTATVAALRSELAPLLVQVCRHEGPEGAEVAPVPSAVVTGRHDDGRDRRFRAVAVGPDGHAVAASPEGLCSWDGVAWRPFRWLPEALVARLGALGWAGANRWVGALDGGEVVLFGPGGVTTSQQVGPAGAAARAIAVRDEGGRGEPRELTLAAAFEPGPLFGFSAGAWQSPWPLAAGERVVGLALPSTDTLVALVRRAGRAGERRVFRMGGRGAMLGAEGCAEAGILDDAGRVWCGEGGLSCGAARIEGVAAGAAGLRALRVESAWGLAVDGRGRVWGW